MTRFRIPTIFQRIRPIWGLIVSVSAVVGTLVAIVGLQQARTMDISSGAVQATVISIQGQQLTAQVVMGDLLRDEAQTPIAESAATPATAATTSVPAVALSQTPTPEPTTTPSPVPTDTPAAMAPLVTTPDGATWVYVPAGEFLMGSADGDAEAEPDERPQHTVYLDAFWIMQTEVTNAMYAVCVEAGACAAPPNVESSTQSGYYGEPQFADYPVINVSWADASKYCEWAGGRLPTEAEWEKAARGTDGRIYPWGDDPPDAQRSNFGKHVGDTTLVGLYLSGASPYGALDMAGNVWEWTSDWYAEVSYANSPAQNPTGPSGGDLRVRRGGSWKADAINVRTADRYGFDPDNRRDVLGFRCVRSP
jgi:formylglycine-generating enzyme required for sulfatase activity